MLHEQFTGHHGHGEHSFVETREDMPGQVALNASEMLSANIANLLDEFWNKEEKKFVLDFDEEITKGCVVIHNGELVNQMVKDVLNK